MPCVFIVVLNWNRWQETLACLESLRRLAYPNIRIIVVDNGSTDASQKMLRREVGKEMLIFNPRNLGFSGGLNVGIRRAIELGAARVFLLNDDTVVAPDCLDRLVGAFATKANMGVAGPTIYYHEVPRLVWSAGGSIDWRRGNTRMMGLNQPGNGQFGILPRPVDFVTGCAMLIKTKALEEVGLFDERFFAYYEDVDWCVRALRKGYKCVHVPLALVWHKIPVDAREDSPAVLYYMVRNWLLFLKNNGARLPSWGMILVGGYLRTLVSWSLRSRWRRKRSMRRIMLMAIRDACLNRWGPCPFPSADPFEK